MRVVVGEGSCGIAAGASAVRSALEALGCKTGIVGCIGMCYLEPIVDVYGDDGQLAVRLVKVGADAAPRIAEAVKSGDFSGLSDLAISEDDKAFLEKQTRIALRNCGVVDPESIESYRAAGGYKALEKIFSTGMSGEDVIEEIKISALAGRGGAGFPTWFKWNAARKSQGEEKYLICNADEGDPGAFMDRAVIESDPHSLIEGMLIAAYAIGAEKAYVYVRAEYPLAIVRLQKAIADAQAANLLGENILGSGFSCSLKIKAGAGAFVCGEETALIESLEGSRGMPRLKPPFPAERGFTGAPSNINNVETFANVAWILTHGGAAFAALGTELHEFVVLHPVVIDASAGDFDGAVGHVVDEGTVVRHEHHGTGIDLEEVFEPLDGLDVEVVGRFVEQEHIRSSEEEFRQLDTHTPSATELGGRAVEVRTAESQAHERTFYLGLIVHPSHHLEALVFVRKSVYQFVVTF